MDDDYGGHLAYTSRIAWWDEGDLHVTALAKVDKEDTKEQELYDKARNCCFFTCGCSCVDLTLGSDAQIASAARYRTVQTQAHGTGVRDVRGTEETS
jgi:hypothetical protein